MQRSVKSAKSNLPKKAQKQQNNRSGIKSTNSVGVARNFVSVTGNPRIVRKENSIVITHREYFSDIESSQGPGIPLVVGDSRVQTKLNPANSELFPWLSSLTPNYETYKFHKLEFDYQPYCATSRSGTTIIAIDYDPSDDPPTTKVDLMSFEESVRTNVWSPVTHRCQAKNLNKKLYLSDEYSTSLSTDPGTLRSKDLGTIYVISTDGPDNSVAIGELYTSYTVELYTPQMAMATSPQAYTSHNTGLAAFSSTGFTYYSNRFHNLWPDTSSMKLLVNLPLGLLFIQQRGTGITLPPGIIIVPSTGINVVKELVRLVNSDGTKAVFIATITAVKNTVFGVTIGASTTVTGWNVDILPANFHNFNEWLEVD